MDTLDFNHFARPQSYGDSSEETGRMRFNTFSRVRSERNSVILCPAAHGYRILRDKREKGKGFGLLWGKNAQNTRDARNHTQERNEKIKHLSAPTPPPRKACTACDRISARQLTAGQPPVQRGRRLPGRRATFDVRQGAHRQPRRVAIRGMRTYRRLGIKAVAVPPTWPRAARATGRGVQHGPAPSAESYLVGDKIIDVCLKTERRQHPATGFSENAEFSEKS